MAKQYDVLFRLLLIGDSGVGKTCLLCRFTDNEFHSSHISTIGILSAPCYEIMKDQLAEGIEGLAERRKSSRSNGRKAFLGEEEAVACEFLVGLVALLRLQASVVSPFSEVLLELALTAAPQAGACGVDFKMKTIEVDGIKVRIQIWDTAGQERYQTITKQYYRRAQGIFLVYDISSERSYQHIMKWVSDVDEYAPEGVQKILIGNKADEEQKRQVGREQGQQLAKEYGMDFYETSACTNLNIKEVRAPQTSGPVPGADQGVGRPEREVADRSHDQSFTRLTELVLQAHRKELEGLRTRASHELALAELEEEEGKPEGPANSSKTCWC
ncbi:Ras-related protein Rab-15 [Tupaia chinensis]|uniref:small monomeric GTPase n=1 Tax=Tupaia chinensis TaxID=246437 RepID=L9L770_TUPCH|nr:Ras-related protein Rab-15 [Tupaia chinensis]